MDPDSGAGLTLSEIKSVLGESTLDLGSLCKSVKINPLAKYKPLNINTWQTLTEAQRKNSEYGIGPTEYSTNSDTAITKMWGYTKPTSYFRALDFDGYRHDARFGVATQNPTVSLISSGAGLPLVMSPYREGDISLTEFSEVFTAYKDWYLCIVFKFSYYNVNNTLVTATYYKTPSTTFGSGGIDVTISSTEAATITKGATGEISYYAVLSTKSATTLSSSLVSNFCSLPIFEGQSYNDLYGGTITVTASLPDTITYNVYAVQATYFPTKTGWSKSPAIPTELINAGATEDQWGGYFGEPGTPPSGYTAADMVAYFSTPSGNASFWITMQNSGNSAFTLSTENLKAKVSWLGLIKSLDLKFYDPISLSEVDTISVPAKGSVSYYVSLPQGGLSSFFGVLANVKVRTSFSIVLNLSTPATVISFPRFNITNA